MIKVFCAATNVSMFEGRSIVPHVGQKSKRKVAGFTTVAEQGKTDEHIGRWRRLSYEVGCVSALIAELARLVRLCCVTFRGPGCCQLAPRSQGPPQQHQNAGLERKTIRYL